MSGKSVIVAYLAWLLGGWIGLHHFYLGRDKHAFTWWITWGGGLGLGWIREMWRLPDYVAEANNDPVYLAELQHQARRTGGQPPFSMLRFIGQLMVGLLFGYQMLSVVPLAWTGAVTSSTHSNSVAKFTLVALVYTIAPTAVAYGVHLVGNIGRQRVRFRTALLGAYCSLPFLLLDPNNIQYTALFSAIACNIAKNKSWHVGHYQPSRGFCYRLLLLIVCCNLYSALWFMVFSHNAHVTTRDGQTILVKDAIKNFFNSPAWEEMKDTFYALCMGLKTHGYKHAWDEFVIKIDPEGETHAYRTLCLTSSANESEISAAYRRLAKKHHPDRERDPLLKEQAQERFMEIQQAYETISSIKTRRTKKSARTQTSTTSFKKTEL